MNDDRNIRVPWLPAHAGFYQIPVCVPRAERDRIRIKSADGYDAWVNRKRKRFKHTRRDYAWPIGPIALDVDTSLWRVDITTTYYSFEREEGIIEHHPLCDVPWVPISEMQIVPRMQLLKYTDNPQPLHR